MITEEHHNQLKDIIDRALDNTEILSKFQNTFISEWYSRLEMQGERVSVSDKQQWVFDQILTKLEKHDV